MQLNYPSVNDLRWLRDHTRLDWDTLQQYVLAGLMNEQLKACPMTVLGRAHSIAVEYPIVAFEVLADKRKEGHRRDEYTHYMVVPVIDQPDIKFERIATHNRDADVYSIIVNRGYVEPPKEPEPESADGAATAKSEAWSARDDRLGSGRRSQPDLQWGKSAWQEMAYHQVALMRLWSEAFQHPTQTFKRFGQGEVVVWQQYLQPERWPAVPMFRVVTQVEPFINGRSEVGSYGSVGVVDTILVPLADGSPVYARSEDLYTLAQYEGRLLGGTPNPHHSMYSHRREEFQPSTFVIESVIKKIPDELNKDGY